MLFFLCRSCLRTLAPARVLQTLGPCFVALGWGLVSSGWSPNMGKSSEHSGLIANRFTNGEALFSRSAVSSMISGSSLRAPSTPTALWLMRGSHKQYFVYLLIASYHSWAGRVLVEVMNIRDCKCWTWVPRMFTILDLRAKRLIQSLSRTLKTLYYGTTQNEINMQETTVEEASFQAR